MYNNASMQIYGIFLTSATIFEELISWLGTKEMHPRQVHI